VIHDLGLLILRVGMGGLMLTHGWGKLVGFSQMMNRFPDPLGVGSPVSLALAVFAEVFCAFALTIGLGTKLVAFPLVVTMFVAGFIVHGNDPWSKTEFTLLYLIPFLSLMMTGAGRFSVDSVLVKFRLKQNR